MKLTVEQIRALTKGAVRVFEEDGGVCFRRFTEEQERLYSQVSNDFYGKTYATAGVRLELVTDSRSLAMTYSASSSSSRRYFNCDITVNGELVCALGEHLDSVPNKKPVVSGGCELGEGEKKVIVYFPWSASLKLISFELDDGASVTPIERPLKMIMFGDSITHGYDAANPSLSYASLLTDALNAESINKGIGGEIFRPQLATARDSFEPHIITVAYGTNDWGVFASKEQFDAACEGFYSELSKAYPDARIYAMTPIWRGDYKKTTRVGEFGYIAQKIKEVAESLPNVEAVDCFGFIPQDPQLFSYDTLHPVSSGFRYYAEALVERIANKKA